MVVWMVLKSKQPIESEMERHSHAIQAGVSLRDWLLRSLWCPFPRDLGVVPLSGALGVGVVAA